MRCYVVNVGKQLNELLVLEVAGGYVVVSAQPAEASLAGVGG